MELMLNELSIHGQFHDSTTLRDALSRIMAMKKLADDSKRVLYCRKGTLYTRLARAGTPLIEVLSRDLSRDQIRVIRRWLDTSGPFWEEEDAPPNHDSGDMFECNDDDITGYGLAEAAYRNSTRSDLRMVSVSVSPSEEWNYTPLTVNWLKQDGTDEEISVCNYWEPSTLKEALEQSAPPPESWSDLEDVARQRFVNLNFTQDSFRHLKGRSLSPKSLPDKILRCLKVLDDIRSAGLGSKVGRELYDEYFQGDNAWFSNSSDSEKNNRKFREDMTFHIADTNDRHFCPWHGKVKTRHGPLRIHFTWPVPPGGQLYVVYMGDKLTRR